MVETYIEIPFFLSNESINSIQNHIKYHPCYTVALEDKIFPSKTNLSDCVLQKSE